MGSGQAPPPPRIFAQSPWLLFSRVISYLNYYSAWLFIYFKKMTGYQGNGGVAREIECKVAKM